MNTLVAIKSAHVHAARRKAVQETWLKNLDWADHFFILGRPAQSDYDILSCNASDAFEDIAPKVLAACQYALDSNIDFMFVCDDDTYVVPERLRQSGFEKHDYVGFMRTAGLAYNQGVPYAQGSAFWLSARAMEQVVTSGAMLPGFIDDGAVGRALVDKVPFTHDYRYWPGPVAEPAPLVDNNLISTHKALPLVMYRMHYPWRNR